jgi:hypothetical protein
MGVAAGPEGGPALVVDRLAMQAAVRGDLAAARLWVVGTPEALAPLERLAELLDARL